MSTTREHLIDPTTLPKGQLVEAKNPNGNRYHAYVDGYGYQNFINDVGDGSPLPWGVLRVVTVLVPREEWEPLSPDATTEDVRGCEVKQVLEGVEVRGVANLISPTRAVHAPSGGFIGYLDIGEWFIRKSDDPDASLIAAIRAADTDEAARAVLAQARGEEGQ